LVDNARENGNKTKKIKTPKPKKPKEDNSALKA
jgi:hypothetical protein